MTRKKWAAMRSLERSIKIAEICGCRELSAEERGQMVLSQALRAWIRRHPFEEVEGVEDIIRRDKDGNPVWIYHAHTFPDFLNSLDAMHEAENLLDQEEGEVDTYPENLIKVMSTPEGAWPGGMLWHAEAGFRAEAFALTKEPEEEP